MQQTLLYFLAHILLSILELTSGTWHGNFSAPGKALSRAQAVQWVLLRAVGILVGFELLYLLGANTLLSTRLARSAVESARGLKLEYASAYSLRPGRIHFRGLRMRFEDRNVQFRLTIGRGQFDVSLHELASRTFHVLSVQAEDVTYRFRHKVHSISGKDARLAAYPPIEGFADPPLYREEPIKVSTPEDKLWHLHIGNVTAKVRELWILEFRFSGDAEASGSFVLHPRRWVQVSPGRIEFRSGGLHAGPHLVASELRGSIQCVVPGLDVHDASGAQVFHGISATSELQLSRGRLDFLSLYTLPSIGATLSGDLTGELHAKLERGRIGVSTTANLRSKDFSVRLDGLTTAGGLNFTLLRDPNGDRLRTRLELENVRLQTELVQLAGPTLRHASGALLLSGVDVTEAFSPSDAELNAQIELPQLAWFDQLIPSKRAPRLYGRGSGKLHFERASNGTGNGRLELALENAGLIYREKRVKVEGRVFTQFRTEEYPHPFAQGALSARLAGAESWLDLALGPFLKVAVENGLDVGAVDATVAFHVARKRIELELTRAQSGKLEAKGFLRLPKGAGAVLLSAGPWRLGVTLENGTTRFSPLVSEQWLDDARKSTTVAAD